MTFLSKALSLSSNRLHGTLPASLLGLPLSLLNLSSNMFQGRLDDFLSQAAPTNNSLAMDLSHNALSGPLPASLFRLGLRVVRLSSNCMSSSLPMEVCSAEGLQVLALDGLGSGSSCSKSFGSLVKVLRYSHFLQSVCGI